MRDKVSMDRWVLTAVLVAIFGIAQFVYCVPTAMSKYPGGSLPKRDSIGYQWGLNFLSDLGRTHSISGQDNSTSAAFFNRSIIVLGICLCIFFALLGYGCEEWVWTIPASQVLGFLSALGLIGIGLTPLDLALNSHYQFLALWLLPMPLLAIVLTIENLSQPILGLAYGLMAGCISIGLVMYASAGTVRGYVVMQKIVVGIAMVWFMMICVRVSFSAIVIVSARGQSLAEAAEKYERRLMKGHRVKKSRNRNDHQN
jgi:hypothetical membrane protein